MVPVGSSPVARVRRALFFAWGTRPPVTVGRPFASEEDRRLHEPALGNRRLAVMCGDAELRAQVRAAVLADDGRERARREAERRRWPHVREMTGPDHWPVDRYVLTVVDPDMLSRYVDAIAEERTTKDHVDSALAAGLICESEAVAVRALELLRVRHPDDPRSVARRMSARAGNAPRVPPDPRPQALTPERAIDADGWAAAWNASPPWAAPVDRARVEAGICRCLDLSGRGVPRTLTWVGSPFAAAAAVETARAGRDPFVDEVSGGPQPHHGPRWPGDFRGPTPDPLIPRIDRDVQNRGDQQVALDSVQRLVHSRIRHPPLSVWRLADLLDAPLSTDSGPPSRRCRYWRHGARGLVPATWLAAVRFLREVCGLRLPFPTWDLLDALTDASAAGPWWVLDDRVVIASPPDVIRIDARGRLRSADGPAVRWPDGSVVHTLDGGAGSGAGPGTESGDGANPA